MSEILKLREAMLLPGQRPDGKPMFSTTKEVLELSREPVDAALFEVPSGYVETTNSQELYGLPSMDATSQIFSVRTAR